MRNVILLVTTLCSLSTFALLGAQPAAADTPRREVSSDGRIVAFVPADEPSGPARVDGTSPLVYGTVPDWSNTLRRQVGGLAVGDLDGDGMDDVAVGCYSSNSFPPYDDWHNFAYLNVGGELEADPPSWISADQVSTGDVQLGDLDGQNGLDLFSANGGFAMAASVVYFNTGTGLATTPGWSATDVSWTNYGTLFDVDHDGDLDLFTANQGNSKADPYRPMYGYRNHLDSGGSLETTPTWQSAEQSIQNFLSFGDLDGDGWEDLAVSKWANFESGVYSNVAGTLATAPVWTTGDTGTDKGIGWADVDGDGDADLALGREPTTLFTNTAGTLTPTWGAVAPYFGHSDLRWADVDRDGDLDLAEIHFGNGVANLYLNDGGVLGQVPAWSYDASVVGTALAFGDITGNGFLDLVLGYSGEPSVRVFYNQYGIFADGFENGLDRWVVGDT